MYVWYMSKHRHNKILGAFGNVLGTFWECLEASGNASERFGASRNGLERSNAFRAYGSVWQARQARQAG